VFKRVSTHLGVVALIALLFGAAAASPASADSVSGQTRAVVTATPNAVVSPRSCQAPNAQADLFLSNGNILTFNCTLEFRSFGWWVGGGVTRRLTWSWVILG
jgi:hypothetical protein